MDKLIEMREKHPQTELWTDSPHTADHAYGLTRGITGITTSPTWVSRMLCNEEGSEYERVLCELRGKHPEYSEQEMIRAWILEMGKRRSRVLLPLWEQGNPKQGRFFIQISIYDYSNTEKMVCVAEEINSCGPNMQVGTPSTREGIKAMEEAILKGISAMATVCFSVDQAVVATEAIEREMRRRTAQRLSNVDLNPVCVVLLGMQGDWLKSYAESGDTVVHPDASAWCGVVICKEVYRTFQGYGYKTRVLTAYYHHQLYWSEFIEGDIIMTIPAEWQRRLANCDVETRDYTSEAVAADKLKQLTKLAPFVQVYTQGFLTEDNFNSFGPVIPTIRYFAEEYEKAVHKACDVLLPNPIR